MQASVESHLTRALECRISFRGICGGPQRADSDHWPNGGNGRDNGRTRAAGEGLVSALSRRPDTTSQNASRIPEVQQQARSETRARYTSLTAIRPSLVGDEDLRPR